MRHIVFGHPLLHTAQSGIALIATLIGLSILTLIGLTMLYVSTMDTLILSSQRAQLQHICASESATEEARDRIREFLATGDLLPADPNKVVYIVSNPSQIQPTSGDAATNPYYDQGYSPSFTTRIVSAQLAQTGYSWVRIAPKSEVRSGYSLTNVRPLKTDPVYFGYELLEPGIPLTQYVNTSAAATSCTGTPVFLVAAFSRSSDGASQQVQADVGAIPPVPLEATFYSRDPVILDSAAVHITGQDESPQPNDLPGLESAGDVAGDISNVQGLPPAVRAHSSFSYDLASLLRWFKPPLGREIQQAAPSVILLPNGAYVADNVALGQADPAHDVSQTVYVDGGLSISNSTGQGILIVNGDLAVTGNFSYWGLIIVKGNVVLAGSSLPGIEIHGAVLSHSATGSQPSQLSGNIQLTYNSASIRKQFDALPYLRLAIRSVY